MKFHIAVLFALTLIFSACDDNSTESTSTGTLNGSVRLFDETGREILNRSGVTVSLKENQISTITNEDGFYHLKNVPIGTYTILFSKPGFEAPKIFGFQFNGYGDVRVDELPELLKTAKGTVEQINLSTRKSDSSEMFVIRTTASQDVMLVEGAVSYILKLSNNATSSWEDSKESVYYELRHHEVYNENVMFLDMIQKRFGSGTTIYATARINHPRYGVRFDNFGNKYYVGLGQSSPTVSFVIP